MSLTWSGPHDARRLEVAKFQRPSQTDHIGPVLTDQPEIDRAFAKAVERAIIGLPVDPPQPGVTQIGQPRAELVAQQPEQAEHRIGIRGGVGHEFHRLQFGFLFKKKGEQHQAVTQCSGNHDAIQAAELVRQQIVPGHTPGLTEIFRIGSGMDGARGRGEAHAIRRSNVPRAPAFHERQRRMGGDDPRIGGRDGFRTDEILTDPGQTLPPADRLDADIAGFGDQSRAQADLEMLYPGLPFAEMREGFGEAGAPHDFQQEIRHASLWHSSLNSGAQRAQGFRILQPVEWRDDNACSALFGFEAQIGIVRRPVRDEAVGIIKQPRQARDLGFGIERAIERPANDQPGCLPGCSFQHPTPWIAVPGPWVRENIAAFHGGPPGVDDREHISPGISDVTFRIQNMRLPGLRYRRRWRITHLRIGPIGVPAR